MTPSDNIHSLDFSSNITEVESVCLNCYEQGVTKFFPTRIPYFREVVIASFECPHCSYHNNDLINAASIAENGVKYELKACSMKDLGRQMVVSEYCRICLPEIDFEVDAPGKTGGYLTTVEGILMRIMEGIQALVDSENFALQKPRLMELLEKVQIFSTGESPFTLIMDDHSGNSYLERLDLNSDLALKEEKYTRTAQQHSSLGFAEVEAQPELDESLYTFIDGCPGCGNQCETRMHQINIPHFKEVIIMATVCDLCGFKSNEVKSGGAVNPLGRRTTLSLETIEDLSRDILKSESCKLVIPDIELELGTGTLGGRFTTVEGLLDQVKNEFVNKVPFAFGDSADIGRKAKLDSIVAFLQDIIDGTVKTKIIFDDPLGNSYVQSLYAPDPDPQITEESYERTYDQNEDFGLNDIKVENYQ